MLMISYSLTNTISLQDDEKGESTYEGAPASLEFVKQYIFDEGPFDGIWAFSQVKKSFFQE